MIAPPHRRSPSSPRSPSLREGAHAPRAGRSALSFTALAALGAIAAAAPACSDRVSGPPYASSGGVYPSGGSIVTTATSSGSGAGDAGGAGGAGGAGSVSVAVGGCYDAASCGLPDDEGTTGLGCLSCAIPQYCETQSIACKADAACSLIYQCVLACGHASCINPCLAQTPEGASAYRALLTCGYCNCSLTSICNQDRDAIEPPIHCP